MDFKRYWKEGKFPFVIKSLLVALLIGVVLLLGIYFWLKHYTRHGEELQVPDDAGCISKRRRLHCSRWDWCCR